MPHHIPSPLSSKQNPLSAGMGLVHAPLPAWLVNSTAVQSALTRDAPRIDKEEHLRRTKRERDAIRLSGSFLRKFAKLETAAIPHLVTSWGVIQMAPSELYEGEEGLIERATLRLRPRVLATEPELLRDLFFLDTWLALDLVLTGEVAVQLLGYRGPAQVFVHEGDSFLDAAAICVDGPVGRTDWRAVGAALAAVLDDSFHAAIVKLIDRVRNLHSAARRRLPARR
jgi:hypothetical protein